MSSRPRRLLLMLCVAIAFLMTGASTGAAATQAGRCTVQLRVDIFGGRTTWALQAGTTVGQLAVLRAVARGCSRVERIVGRWVGRPSAAPLQRPCTGSTCFLRVRVRRMAAIDFQAVALTGAGRRVRSNVVRVAWAGRRLPTWTGTWTRNEVAGTLTLNQSGANVTGSYDWSGGGTLSGTTTTNGVFTGTFSDSVGTGSFRIVLASDGGSYTGTYTGNFANGGGPFSGNFSGSRR